MSSSGGSPTQLDAARTPLAGEGRAQQRPWGRFVGPLVALVATGGVAVGLVLLLDNKFSLTVNPPKSLGAGGGKMECGVYQNMTDPTVKLTDAEIWQSPGA
jgi:hypothetical protein